MTVRELLERIDSRELSEWIAFFEMEPWGTEVEDWRSGLVASTIANVNRDPKKKRKPFQPEDFMPRRDQPQKEEQSWEEQARILEQWAKAWENKFGDS